MQPPYVAHPPEGVDRNTPYIQIKQTIDLSPSTRRAWIEVQKRIKGGVILADVALHPEGVDRNLSEDGVYNLVSKVALHPEGVDRNNRLLCCTLHRLLSPSTRRAWIEIRTKPSPRKKCVCRPPPGGRG